MPVAPMTLFDQGRMNPTAASAEPATESQPMNSSTLDSSTVALSAGAAALRAEPDAWATSSTGGRLSVPAHSRAGAGTAIDSVGTGVTTGGTYAPGVNAVAGAVAGRDAAAAVLVAPSLQRVPVTDASSSPHAGQERRPFGTPAPHALQTIVVVAIYHLGSGSAPR